MTHYPTSGPATQNEVFQPGIDIPGLFSDAKAYFQSPNLVGPEIEVNNQISAYLSGADAILSFLSFFNLPAGPFLAIGSITNFVQDVNGKGAPAESLVFNGLIVGLSYLTNNPILSHIGSFALGFNLGNQIARTHVWGTVNSTFGDIYADFLTAPEKIKLK